MVSTDWTRTVSAPASQWPPDGQGHKQTGLAGVKKLLHVGEELVSFIQWHGPKQQTTLLQYQPNPHEYGPPHSPAIQLGHRWQTVCCQLAFSGQKSLNASPLLCPQPSICKDGALKHLLICLCNKELRDGLKEEEEASSSGWQISQQLFPQFLWGFPAVVAAYPWEPDAADLGSSLVPGWSAPGEFTPWLLGFHSLLITQILAPVSKISSISRRNTVDSHILLL